MYEIMLNAFAIIWLILSVKRLISRIKIFVDYVQDEIGLF